MPASTGASIGASTPASIGAAGQAGTGAGSIEPVMRIAANVEPATLSGPTVPDTVPHTESTERIVPASVMSAGYSVPDAALASPGRVPTICAEKLAVLSTATPLTTYGSPTGMLYVDADNISAVRLYESLGFATAQVQQAYTNVSSLADTDPQEQKQR